MTAAQKLVFVGPLQPVAKPAGKTAKTAGKPAAVAKPAAVKPAAKPAKPAAAAPLGFAVRDGYRPGAGRLLFAYTQAWLDVSGLTAGKTIARADLVKVAGQTAVAYHTGRTGTLSDNKGAISLTDSGAAFFKARGADQKAVDAFSTVLRTGCMDETVGVKVPAAVVPLKAQAAK